MPKMDIAVPEGADLADAAGLGMPLPSELEIYDGPKGLHLLCLTPTTPGPWGEHLASLSSKEILDILENYDIWAVEFSELKELMDHPQVQALELVQDLGDRKFVRAPWLAPWGLPELREAPNL